MPHDVLLLEDLGVLEPTLTAAGCAVRCEERAALSLSPAPDLVIVDVEPTTIRQLRAMDPSIPIIATSTFGDVGLAERVVAAGATDLLVLGPALPERVRVLLGKLRPMMRLIEEQRRQRPPLWALVGQSAAMRTLRERILRVATVPRPVLILGERGTGKELVARAIHDAAGPPGRPLVVVNCGAFPDTLLENELFGHERGSYTGAERRAPGRFEQASGGTLFLDEVAAMSTAFQQKILRVVEYGVFYRVGGANEVRTTARIIAATNADLRERIAEGAFLPDLYDRLAFEVLEVPPLRARGEDLPLLAHYFLERFQEEIPALQGRRLSPEALDALAAWPFPGNVRELKNRIERAAYQQAGAEITVSDLGLEAPPPIETGSFEARVEAFRARLLNEALTAAHGNQAEAARRLGLSYDQFRHWYRKRGG